MCLDARTGKRVWHQQLVHHDIWDYDLASPPNLINITVNGQADPGGRAGHEVGLPVRLRSRQRHAGVADRGAPGRSGHVPGEWYSPTQPHPTKPAPYDRQGVSEADLIDFTPELNAEARAMIKEYKIGPLFTPPIVRRRQRPRAARCRFPAAQGAALWQGAAWDPETKMLYVPSVTNMTANALQPGGERSDMNFIGGGGGGGRGAAPAPARARAAGGAPPAPVPRRPQPRGPGAGRWRRRWRRARRRTRRDPAARARARAAARGASGRRGCRSSSRRTAASRPTT